MKFFALAALLAVSTQAIALDSAATEVSTITTDNEANYDADVLAMS